MSRASFRARRKAHRGPLWRRMAYYSLRGILYVPCVPLKGIQLAGIAASAAIDLAAMMLHRAEKRAWPGFWAELPRELEQKGGRGR